MKTPDIILRLCDIFSDHKKHYKSSSYNETQLRREFLDPFWKALGWDIDNERGITDTYKDVIHEDSIRIGGSVKAPDYCFRIGGTRKFFVEAKRPSINIKENVAPAFQLRRYAWSAKLQASVVSDFEEFSIYDTTICPSGSDKVSVARTSYFTFEDYSDNWDEISAVFSRDAVLNGSLDEIGEKTKKNKFTYEVDNAFLNEIEHWRNELAKNLSARNSKLSIRDLNYAVQKIIDRIIFLRICEDRGIEDYGRLKDLETGEGVYDRLLELFQDADARYNSGLFHFQTENKRAGYPDKLTPSLHLDDKVISSIVQNLYYPESPYEFSVLPADILGQVYERFLGKIIRFTANHKVKIEDKPEVRKAGGVYYTPTYVVEYIVGNTLGRLLNGPNPNEPMPIPVSKAARLKILDPACGSGSFLISAYQYLLDWHRDQYAVRGQYHSRGKNPKLYQAPGGEWQLTTAERKRILLANIHGVDIDSQAVEVTKLSLLLKVLEGETRQKLQRDFLAQRERILPDLGNNIRCGNSLIAPNYYDNKQMQLIADDELYKVNVFSWEDGFPTIMSKGGFSCVIGNPPWGADFSEKELEYLRGAHRGIIVRMIDSFMYFVSASFRILEEEGYFGMILPDVFLYQKDNEKLRRLVFERYSMTYAINSGNVFEEVTRPTAIVIARNTSGQKEPVCVADLSAVKKVKKAKIFSQGLAYESAGSDLFLNLPQARIPTGDIADYSVVSKIMGGNFPRLLSIVDKDGIQRGVSPDLKKAFILTSYKAERLGLESKFLRPVYTGGIHVKRYQCLEHELVLVYTTRDTNFSECPKICRRINALKKMITCKEVIQGKHPLYALHRPREQSIFEKPNKLLGVITEDEIILGLDNKQTYATDGLYLFALENRHLTNYLMGILNSRLFVFLYRRLSIEGGRVLAQVKPTLLAHLPIRPIDFQNSADLNLLDKMNSLVDAIMSIILKHSCESNPDELNRLAIRKRAIDRQIDSLVYDIYNLSGNEIQVVELATPDRG